MLRFMTTAIACILAHDGVANRLPAFISNTHLSHGRTFRNRHSFMHINIAHAKSRHSILSSTLEKGNNNPSGSSTEDEQPPEKVSYNVIYQKVLRPRSKEASNIFLINLLSYVQSMHELPDGLTMPYETTIPEDNHDVSSENRAILIIDSPMAEDVTQARIEVEIIGIFPDDDEKQSVPSSPTMAMVALKKIKPKNGNSGNSATQGFFADCEKRIVQSFDRGLQDFEEGRVDISSFADDTDASGISNKDEFNDLDDDGIDAAIKRMGYQNAINSASSDVHISAKDKSKNSDVKEPKKPISIERDEMGNVIIDSKISPVKEKKKKNQQHTSMKKEAEVASQTRVVPAEATSTQKEGNKQPRPVKTIQATNDSNEDYAIHMARKKAEALMKPAQLGSSNSFTISGGESEFAIQAAAAAARRPSIKSSKASSKGQETVKSESTDALQPNAKKQKVQDLSKDPMFIKLQSLSNKSKQKSWSKTIFKKGSSQALKKAKKETAISTIESSNDARKSSDDNEIDAASPLGVDTTLQKSDDDIRKDIEQIAKENKEVQDLLKSATDMIPNDGDEDLTPEELLERVLKFGDEKEKEEKPGFGFVEGAMDKAKDLLKTEQNNNNQRELGYKEMDRDEHLKRKLEEDELKRIFAAGQNTAQNKLSNPTPNPSEMTKAPMTEEEIDALIAADETVPLNARKLDEEFAEFEVRVAKSLGEENDGPSRNKMFDVMSGPEVYNPNVDPATAVNWPGAKEGTRTDVQLAKELEEALKQARFAAAVLLNMREEESDTEVRCFVGEKEISAERVALLKKCVREAVKAGIIEDPNIQLAERSRLQMLIDELTSQPEERLEEIAMNYKDLLLSDNFIELVRERLYAMAQRDLMARQEGKEHLLKDAHARERAIMMNLVQIAQSLIKETQALGAELEVSMLEIIRSICEVAMDPSHTTEEETAVALTDAVRDMRPLLDDAFVAYLKYAIAEEEAKLERQGVVDDPEYNRWLFILQIIQEGVYAELSRGVKRYIDHIGYVLRMKAKAERRDLLAKLIDVMPTMDVRPFVKVVNNIVSSLGTSVRGDFSDGILLGEMTNKLLQLQRDVEELLPPDRVDEMSKDADSWAAKQRERLMERQKMTRQRLRSARETSSIDPDKVIASGEYDRFD